MNESRFANYDRFEDVHDSLDMFVIEFASAGYELLNACDYALSVLKPI